ncbi:MAG: alanine--tRNA ligase [Simkaniaceae bacterium]|nr:alanine--tRNA ligase [Simkaniaceae bacterium]
MLSPPPSANLLPMLSREIRTAFLRYFRERDHVIVPSSPTIPHDDPSLLFVNAGMNRFKDVFLGEAPRDYPRAASSQKCIRVGGKHNDLENVGHTRKHVTFFEMLGNFSFGDYFKKEAITYAWDVATSLFRFPEERLFISVYEEDEEAYALWEEIVGEEKISRIGAKDNFWAMGRTGPCGPCSELFFDRGEAFGSATNVGEDRAGTRFLEFWNLVFMEYETKEDGTRLPLSAQSVDTGAGLERVLALMIDAPTVFQTDILYRLIRETETIARKTYDLRDPASAPAFHVIADHVRSLAFAIADGAEPGNTERGYVLRKILRRAVRYGRTIGLDRPFLARLIPPLIEAMGADFHELPTAQSRIEEILTFEEEGFLQTLRRGGNILSKVIERALRTETKTISGEEAFKLKDTYGFPIEEILLIAKDNTLSVDVARYRTLEEEARKRSQKAQKRVLITMGDTIYETFLSDRGPSGFVGYDEEHTTSRITGLIVDDALVDKMEAPREGIVILRNTPFYAEKGGQVGDTGLLVGGGAFFSVTDCISPFTDVIAHVGLLEKGTLRVGQELSASIDTERRLHVMKNHTATHLLHYALQQVVGSHIRQAGSLVEPGRIRFDFNHHKRLPEETMREVERLVNAKIRGNGPVTTCELPFDEVRERTDIKQFFGDKYGNIVRLVDIDGYSKELCGGTHIPATGMIGTFRITKEGSIAKGVRRIEAVTGACADVLYYEMEDRLSRLRNLLGCAKGETEEAVGALIRENDRFKEKALFARQRELTALADSLMKGISDVHGVPVLSSIVKATKKEMFELGNDLMQRLRSGIVFLCRVEKDACELLLKVSPDLVQKGVYANEFIKRLASYVEGSGGGKKDSAQAGGKNAKGIIIAFDEVKNMLKEKE